MKKMIFALLLAVSFALPSIAHAGMGLTRLYCSWFNDGSTTTSWPLRFKNWINVSNPNSNSAKIKIKYYKEDGNLFANTSSFTKTISVNGSLSWRPNDDLGLGSSDVIQGSYVIEAVEGSISADSTITRLAGDTLNDTNFPTDDFLSVHPIPLETQASTYLTSDAFIQYDVNNDRMALLDKEVITWVHINNPDNTITAKVKITFYKMDGTKYNDTPHELTLYPHQTLAFTIGDSPYSINGTDGDNPAKGTILLDVTQGSVIASYAKTFCNVGGIGGNGVKNYRSVGFGFNKITHQ